MTDTKEDNDHRHGKYLLSSACNFDPDELANACRRLGISGSLEPLLRELKIKEGVSNVKESPRKISQKKEKKALARGKESIDVDAYLENNVHTANKTGKNSFGQESWGRDSGARDLSPEPHRGLDSLGAVQQMIEVDAGGSSSMIHLASKVSKHCHIFHSLRISLLLPTFAQNVQNFGEMKNGLFSCSKMNSAIRNLTPSQERLNGADTIRRVSHCTSTKWKLSVASRKNEIKFCDAQH